MRVDKIRPEPLIALLIVALAGLFVAIGHAHAQVSSSTNYKIGSDAASNCGGGYSSSTNYKIYDTICQQATANVSSTNYKVFAGFQNQTDPPLITVTYSGSSIAFGTLSRTSVNTATIDVTVTTNATNGYMVSILSDGNFRKSTANATTTASNEIIAGVTDGTVTAAGYEYGVATSTTDVSIPTSTPRIIVSKSGTASAELTTLTLKAAASETTAAGSYTQTITLITTSTF